MANEEETTTRQPQWGWAGQQAAKNASDLPGDDAWVRLLAFVLMAAFGPTASQESQGRQKAVRDTVPDAEKGAWKDLEVALTKYYRKGHEHRDVSRLVADSMKEEEVGLSGLSPESRRHALGVDVESLSVMSERKDRKLAGIQEPAIDLKEALAKRRESAKLWHIKINGESEAKANKIVNASFMAREEKFIGEMREKGVSDSEIVQSISDSAEAHRRYFAKLEAKSHEHSAVRGQAPKTLEEAAQEFAKHAPKLPTDPQELAKRPTGHPDGHFHPKSTGLSKATQSPGQGSSRK